MKADSEEETAVAEPCPPPPYSEPPTGWEGEQGLGEGGGLEGDFIFTRPGILNRENRTAAGAHISRDFGVFL